MSMIQITPVSHSAEEDGAWGEYLGVRLLIARASNSKFKRIFRRLSKPHKKAIDKGTIDDETAQEIMTKAVAGGILNGWDASTFPNSLEYTEERAIELLRNDQDCMDYVQEFANDLDNYLKEAVEETVKE